MIRVKNERFSRFFRTVAAIFSMRSIAAEAETIQTPALAGTGKPCRPVEWETRRLLPVRKRVDGGEVTFPGAVSGLSRNEPFKFKDKFSRYSKNEVLFTVPWVYAHEAFFTRRCFVMRGEHAGVPMRKGKKTAPIDIVYRPSFQALVFSGFRERSSARAKTSRYSKNKVLFTVPWAYARA